MTVSGVPSGLTLAATRTSDTVVTFTLTGTAGAHGSANSISNLSVTFTDAAFTGGSATGVDNYAKTGIAVTFTNLDISNIMALAAYYNALAAATTTGPLSLDFSSGTTGATIAGTDDMEALPDEIRNRFASVILPARADFTGIGDYAFFQFTNLASPTIPDSVISIGNKAFCDCFGLTEEVTIPDKVTSIGNEAFNQCIGLTRVTIGAGVTDIGDYAFGGCSGLTEVTIGAGVINIGIGAFKDCSDLESVTIPNKVTSFGHDAFTACTGLTEVTIGTGVISIGDGAFIRCNGLTSVTIPDNVTSIDNNAFRGCRGLTTVTIGTGVTDIGSWAFYQCPSLDSLTFTSTDPPSVGNGAFEANNLSSAYGITVRAPGGATGDYRGLVGTEGLPSGDMWGDYP
jgi:hypothetical protein